MGKKVAKLAQVLAAIIFMASAGFAQTTTTTNCTATSTSGSSTNVDCTSTSNTPPSAADNAAAIEQSRKTGEAMGHAAAAPLVVLGQALARKRAIRQQEKSDLTAVVFCRQNPSGSWTFPGKAPMPCGTLDKNVVAYPQPQPQQAPVTTQPVQSVVVPQSQPQSQPQTQPQPQTVEVTTTPEVSVAEAARRNKAAKEAQKAKEAEKAKENPNQ